MALTKYIIYAVGRSGKMNINDLVKREKEIRRELNEGNVKHLQELLGIAYNLSKMYEPCDKCNFISKNKETRVCRECR